VNIINRVTFTASAASIVVLSGLAAGQSFSTAGLSGQPVSITEFAAPTLNSAPFDVTIAVDGSVWFTEKGANKIARMTTAGAFTEYAIPTASSAPEAITSTPSGYLWFTERYGRKIGRIYYTGGPIAEFPVPGTGAFPTAITTDATGKVWFASNQQPNMARIGSISTTGAITLLATGASQTLISGIVSGQDGISGSRKSARIGATASRR